MKYFFLISIIFGLSFYTCAQTALPYYTGFDNVVEKAGWMQFRKGWIGNAGWGIAPSGGYSAPAYLGHDYPAGAALTDTTTDWYVSPAFNFSSGAKIDSLKINVHVTNSITPVDHIGIYLLAGSNNPSLATSVTLLADLTNLHSANYNWRDTTFIFIPSTPGLSYIGYKYRTTQNLFTVRLDNMHIGTLPIETAENTLSKNQLLLFPNPTNKKINILIQGNELNNAEIIIFNCVGQILLSKHIENEHPELDISNILEGVYYVQLINNKKVYWKKLCVLKH